MYFTVLKKNTGRGSILHDTIVQRCAEKELTEVTDLGVVKVYCTEKNKQTSKQTKRQQQKPVNSYLVR